MRPTEHELLSKIELAKVECVFVSRPVLEKMTYRENPDAWLGVARIPNHSLQSVPVNNQSLLIVVEGVEKPGNLGAILRSADAAGAHAVLVCDGRTDAWNPNVVRAILLGAFVGEIVWVSYAIRSLYGKFTPFVGSQIVGTVWTLWWLPMVILNVGVIPGLPPLALWLSMLGIAAMCSFVYTKTKSGLAVLVLQIMVNSSALILPVIPTTGGVPTFVAYSAVYYLCVLLLYLFFGPRPLLRIGGCDSLTVDGTPEERGDRVLDTSS
jgi:hypothetical protein